MGQPMPVTLPLKGLNTLNPFIDFESGYARELTNYGIQNGAIKMRPAVRQIFPTNPPTAGNIAWRGIEPISGDFAGIEYGTGDIIDLTTSATLGTVTSMGQQAFPTPLRHVSLYLVFGVGAPRLADYPFTTWTFTTLGITATQIKCGCSHKGRLYVCDGSTIEYSAIGQITGAIPANNTYPISQFMEGQSVLRMFSVTAQPGNETSNVLVIFGDRGLVLIYGGDYPGDPNWRLVAKFSMKYPIGGGGFVEINGDIFVATYQYSYWFRDLFNGGAQTAYDNRSSMPIDNLWQSLFWGPRTGPVFNAATLATSHIFYYPELNCIICQCQDAASLKQIADYTNDSAYLVYFLDYQAWAVWMMVPMFFPVVPLLSTQTLTASGPAGLQGITSLSPTTVVDEAGLTDHAVETSWKTPYYYPQSGKNKNLSGTSPYFKNTSSGYMHLLQAIWDLSDYNAPFGFYAQESAPTPIPPGRFTDGKIDVPANSWSLYNEFCGVSGNGSGFSLQYTQRIKDMFEESVTQTHQIFQTSINFTEGAPVP